MGNKPAGQEPKEQAKQPLQEVAKFGSVEQFTDILSYLLPFLPINDAHHVSLVFF